MLVARTYIQLASHMETSDWHNEKADFLTRTSLVVGSGVPVMRLQNKQVDDEAYPVE